MDRGDGSLIKPVDVLKKYWGYPQFRSLQEDIINNVLEGKHTLALMPTGGGKSICFQVPGMILEGMTIVVSPLIALMKDQVEQLKRRNIEAAAIVSGMHQHEIDIALDNCIYGKTKFLYVSPERLKSDLFIERLRQMNVNMLAIDEAHCISQWGYDFRPSYLEIAAIRETIGIKKPVLALTATATPNIQNDILTKLEIENAATFRKSFARPNLSYKCIETPDKIRVMFDKINSVSGSVIVYARSRKNTKVFADILEKKGIDAYHYHAGLSAQARQKIQNDWIKNKFKVIVATNAFGMGIDKPDVRLVIHIDLPDSLEAYYQEAGRAGRDEKYAEGIILFQEKDIQSLESKTKARFPELDTLRQIYTAVCNYYQLALGSGEMQSFSLNLSDLGKKFNIPALTLYYGIKELEKHGYLQFEEKASSVSTLNILVDNTELYRFQVANPRYDHFIKTLVRIYGGELFSSYLRISEDRIASRALMTHNQVIDALQILTDRQIVDYIPGTEHPKITFLLPRQNTHQGFITQKMLDLDRERYFERMNHMLNYTRLQNTCRTNYFQEYFGEEKYSECGICDNCQKKTRDHRAPNLKKAVLEKINQLKTLNISDLYTHFPNRERKEISEIIRILIIEESIQIDETNTISLDKKSH
jgi:ATP-dependent DNA helicase RecQ